MESELLITILNTIAPLSTSLTRQLDANLKEEFFTRRQRILDEGQIAKKIYFINEGSARAYYYTRQGKECTRWFMAKGDIMISVYSFFLQQPAKEIIEVLEDSHFLSMTWTALQNLYADHPEFNYIGRRLTEKYYLMAEEREILLRTGTAKERYDALLSSYPGILQKASLGQIASYLNIKQETLSRIRKMKSI